MKKTGLYFGTFNPIHIGHLIIANHMVEFSDMDEIWLVVTPHNPFKKKSTLLDDQRRLEMVYLATEDYPKIFPSKIEFDLPQPNFTVHTLAVLEEKYPEREFSLVMGEDNLKGFHKWKNHDVILERHELFVYPRVSKLGKKLENDLKNHQKVHLIDAPMIEISASAIRKAIKNGKNVRPLLPLAVWEYLDGGNYYR
jgi:nicotinate-nucleotide adenylyltransferase